MAITDDPYSTFKIPARVPRRQVASLRGSWLEFFFTCIFLVGIGLLGLGELWPRLRSLAIFFYAIGGLIIFLTVIIHAIFGPKGD